MATYKGVAGILDPKETFKHRFVYAMPLEQGNFGFACGLKKKESEPTNYGDFQAVLHNLKAAVLHKLQFVHLAIDHSQLPDLSLKRIASACITVFSGGMHGGSYIDIYTDEKHCVQVDRFMTAYPTPGFIPPVGFVLPNDLLVEETSRKPLFTPPKNPEDQNNQDDQMSSSPSLSRPAGAKRKLLEETKDPQKTKKILRKTVVVLTGEQAIAFDTGMLDPKTYKQLSTDLREKYHAMGYERPTKTPGKKLEEIKQENVTQDDIQKDLEGDLGLHPEEISIPRY